jgi:hypothetical protein
VELCRDTPAGVALGVTDSEGAPGARHPSRHRRRGHQELAAPGLRTAAAAPRTASVRLTPSRAENAPRTAAGAWRDVGRVGDPSISRHENDLLEVDVNIELIAKSLGVMQRWETLAASPPPGRRSMQHGPAIANQAPHRHRQAQSGTYRGREPPHARHTCLGQPTADQGSERGNHLDAPAYPLYQEHGQNYLLGTKPRPGFMRCTSGKAR